MKSKIDFKPTQDMINAAIYVFKTMAMVQTIEPIVLNYQRKVLAKHKFKGGYSKDDFKVILDPKDSWLLKDNDFKIYLDEINHERKQAGLHVDNPDHCPLLVAKQMQRNAEKLLIIEMKPITKLDPKDICNIDHYHKLIDLSLKLLTPFVKKGD